MSDNKITDLDARRRVCLAAFENLCSDTFVTMAQVDATLLLGAQRRSVGELMSDKELDEIATAVGIDPLDADAILSWCADDAVKLLADPAPWRFDVPEVPDSVTAFKDGKNALWVRRSEGSKLWSRYLVDGKYAHTVAIATAIQLVMQLGGLPLVECEDPRAAS